MGCFIGREQGGGFSVGHRRRTIGISGDIEQGRRFDARCEIGLQHAHRIARMIGYLHAVAGVFQADGLRPAIGADMGEQTHFVGADGLQQIMEKHGESFLRYG